MFREIIKRSNSQYADRKSGELKIERGGGDSVRSLFESCVYSPHFRVSSCIQDDVQEDFCAPWLQMEPATQCVVPAMCEYLEATDACAVLATCKGLNRAMHDVKGRLVIPHVSDKAKIFSSERLNFETVQSMRITTICHDAEERFDQPPEKELRLANEMPNCRTMWWCPEKAADVPKGEYIESESFAIQGITGIYLRWYPNGKEYSRKGQCSLYIGSDGSERDVTLRLWVGNTSHIITQKLQADFVDGFVNFGDVTEMFASGRINVGIEVLCGVNDSHLAEMETKAGASKATWVIPRMNANHLAQLNTGDRITSDVFSLNGLGDDACFVLYPKGDTVDAISKIGDFVNVGLFGSADRDVTFRLTAGKVTKVMTACCDRFQSVHNGTVRSCGEFFDACFGTLEDLVDPTTDTLTLTLEVLDEEAHQLFSIKEALARWSFLNATNLKRNTEGETMHSRYFTIAQLNLPEEYFQLKWTREGTTGKFSLLRINTNGTPAKVCVSLRVASPSFQEKIHLSEKYNGLMSEVSTKFTLPENFNITDFKLEADVQSFEYL